MAIQTFKDAFIAALAMTDSEFPLQLWDKLEPQVQNTLNLLQKARINPNILAYEALNGPYDWDRYPLAPPGCKAIIYKAPTVQGLWASHGTNAWYLGPSKDHYRCNLYYNLETQAYRVSGSAELFPQHCQVPNLSNTAHLKALTEELTTETAIAAKTRQKRLRYLFNRCQSPRYRWRKSRWRIIGEINRLDTYQPFHQQQTQWWSH